MSILMITHDLSTAAKYADRIIVMKDGKVVEEGDAAAVIAPPRSRTTPVA